PSPIVQDPRYPRTNSNGVLRRPIADDERENVIGLTQNWIPDVTNPILQPGTRVALEEIAHQELAGIPHPQPQTQCLPSGVPLILNTARAISILQTPTEVTFLYSRDHHVWHVYLNQTIPPIANIHGGAIQLGIMKAIRWSSTPSDKPT
ncbi:MAG: hypothetical protein ACKVG0_00660, partial [Alphaproteobacteria bacterium]